MIAAKLGAGQLAFKYLTKFESACLSSGLAMGFESPFDHAGYHEG